MLWNEIEEEEELDVELLLEEDELLLDEDDEEELLLELEDEEELLLELEEDEDELDDELDDEVEDDDELLDEEDVLLEELELEEDEDDDHSTVSFRFRKESPVAPSAAFQHRSAVPAVIVVVLEA